MNQQKYILLKPFIVIFLISLTVWNWNNISWIFNYEIVSDAVQSLPEKIEKKEYIDKENSIEITSINVNAPVIFSKSNDKEEIDKELKKGVVHYFGSALPGEKGKITLLGHNAPASWPDINYYKVFSKLSEIKQGDEIYVYYDHQEYKYKMVRMVIVEPGEEVPDLTNSDSVLSLITCWPPGQNYQRMIIQAEQFN